MVNSWLVKWLGFSRDQFECGKSASGEHQPRMGPVAATAFRFPNGAVSNPVLGAPVGSRSQSMDAAVGSTGAGPGELQRSIAIAPEAKLCSWVR